MRNTLEGATCICKTDWRSE